MYIFNGRGYILLEFFGILQDMVENHDKIREKTQHKSSCRSVTSGVRDTCDISGRLRLFLFMTWDVSLAIWKEKGLLQREIRLYQRLAGGGVDVTLLSWGGDEDDEIAARLLPGIKVVSVYKHIPGPKDKVLRCLCSLLLPWCLRRELKRADIFKTNQMWGSWVASICGIIFKKPVIARCGFELYDFTCRQNHGFLRKSFIWLISRFTYGTARHICVATGEDRDFVIKNFGQDKGKISVHPNWIDTDFFAPRSVEDRKEKHILFVGRLSEQKNLYTLFDALKGSDFVLDIVGKGELREKLEEYAKDKGVNVRFLGSFPNGELPGIYNSYPIFVLPSHYEGNPKTLLEAMACGIAVIGTDVTGISSVIEHEKSGLLCSPDPVSLRKAVDRLMNDGGLRERLGRNARKQIIENQTLDRLVEKELACYNSIIGNQQ